MPNYMCEICGSRFRRRSALAKHMRELHTLNRCTLCGRRYDYETLNLHMRDYHNHRDDGLTSGAQATTHTQHTESLHGIANTVSTINSSLGTANVTIVRSTTSPLVMTAVSQASGTGIVTHLDLERDHGNECPICFDSLNDGETITTPCCNKIFHIACLRRLSLGTEFSCPHCRGVLTRDWLSKTPGL